MLKLNLQMFAEPPEPQDQEPEPEIKKEDEEWEKAAEAITKGVVDGIKGLFQQEPEPNQEVKEVPVPPDPQDQGQDQNQDPNQDQEPQKEGKVQKLLKWLL